MFNVKGGFVHILPKELLDNNLPNHNTYRIRGFYQEMKDLKVFMPFES